MEQFKYVLGAQLDAAKLTLPVIANPNDDPASFPRTIDLNPTVFRTDVRPDVISRVVRWQQAKAQQGTHKSKTISEVSGGGRKPWRQKGTGRARQGSIRNPHFRGGASVFGPTPRLHDHNLNKKERALGLKSALAARFQEGRLYVVSSLDLKNPKTSELAALASSNVWQSALVVGMGTEETFKLASSNIPSLDFLPQIGCNVYDILKHKTLVFSVASLRALEARLILAGLRRIKRNLVIEKIENGQAVLQSLTKDSQ